MSSSYFQISEHTIPCQHIREYPRATKSLQDDTLQLAIKQYTPIRKNGNAPGKNAVTIIATHAIGFPKEAYEPVWDDLLHQSKKYGFEIRNIWIVDMVNMGSSGVLNEHLLGDDPSYADHSRDLLHMVNVFREQMPRPIIGIGHSAGATEMLGLSILHPRLFISLVLMEPMIQDRPPPGMNVAQPSTFRADIWPSHTAAVASFRRTKFFAGMDPRVLENIIKYGLRKVPTALYPLDSAKAKEGSYTLTTTKHQEVWSMLRPNFQKFKPLTSGNRADRVLYPDMNHAQNGLAFYRGDISAAYEHLAYIRPSVLFVFGGKSYLSTIERQDEKMKLTGTGVGGSGGAKSGQVEKYVFENNGHMAPLEDVGGCANVLGKWIGLQISQFKKDEEIIRGYDMERSENEMSVVSKKWMEMVKFPTVYSKTEKANL